MHISCKFSGWRNGSWCALWFAVCLSVIALQVAHAQVRWQSYQAIMWSTDPVAQNIALWFQRLRELEFTAEQCYRGRDPKPFVQHGFGFYVENLVPQLAFHHGRRKLYDEDFRGYTQTRDKKFLVRKPCFDAPAFWDEITKYLTSMAQRYAPHRPLFYNLQDEPSIGAFASPMDYCFCEHTLRAFREWLKGRYGSLGALNREWETNFASWDEVVPMTTYEIKAREREALKLGRLENYAPWADHREFMDFSFAQAIARMRQIIRQVDKDALVGLEGTQMPSAWGGYDLWRLSQIIDWVEPYDICNSREIFRSFMPNGSPILATVFGTDYNRIRLRLWRLLLHGDKGCIVWDDEKSRCIDKSAPDLPPTERGKQLAAIFKEIKAVAPLLFQVEPIVDPIAIHYSQASIRAHWMFDSREDGDTWPRRFSSYEAIHSRLAKARDAFVRLVEDLGFQFEFVSYEQVELGELTRRKFKVLILPQSVAMSEKECEQVKAFVRAGGVAIADNMTATMDEHCKRLPQGQLDDLFGINRKSVGWSPKPSGGEILLAQDEPLAIYEPDISITTGKPMLQAKTPAVIINRYGKGFAVYLNLDMRDYGRLRLSPPKGKAYRELMQRLLKMAGLEAPVKVANADTGQEVACVEVWRYSGKDSEFVALIRNHEFRADELRSVGYPTNEAIEKAEKVRIIFTNKAHIRNVITGQDYGVTIQVTAILEPWAPLIFELR
ncbi:MAG: beta-galactosidase [Armatimonadota bacterium]|nr:beta-galactosidase [Armatimonadota bacterium]MDW8026271.1 beta-galactosidase [Armatimonadota bacterium]